jgi:hypothetical protein
LFTVVLEDFADIAGVALAVLGVWLGHMLDNPYLDGLASIAVGLVLATVALVLMAESRALLVGERAPEGVLEAVREASANDAAFRRIHRPLTMQLGPDEVLLALEAEFRPTAHRVGSRCSDLQVRSARAGSAASGAADLRPVSDNHSSAARVTRNFAADDIDGRRSAIEMSTVESNAAGADLRLGTMTAPLIAA